MPAKPPETAHSATSARKEMPSATTDACTPPTVRPSAEFSGACAASTPPIADATTRATVRSMPRHTSGMALTLGTGPLGSRPGGDFNFGWDGAPAHRLYFEPYPRRVRALVGDRIVLDSLRGWLLFESNLPPRLYVPLGDLDASLLEHSATSTHCPRCATPTTASRSSRPLGPSGWPLAAP